MSAYQLTVTVELPDSLEEEPLDVLSSVVLGALHEHDIPVRSVHLARVES